MQSLGSELRGFSANLCTFFPRQSATEEFLREFGHLAASFLFTYASKLKCNKYAIETGKVKSFCPENFSLLALWAWQVGHLWHQSSNLRAGSVSRFCQHIYLRNFSELDLRFDIHFSGFFQGHLGYFSLCFHQPTFPPEGEFDPKCRKIFNDDRKMILSHDLGDF